MTPKLTLEMQNSKNSKLDRAVAQAQSTAYQQDPQKLHRCQHSNRSPTSLESTVYHLLPCYLALFFLMLHQHLESMNICIEGQLDP
jgi:hypothetical protein